MLEQLRDINLTPFSVVSLIDILIVALVLYKLMTIIRGTRAVQLVKGIVVLLVAATITSWLKLYTINWLLERAIYGLMVALPIVFHPELRRALEQLGRGKFIARQLSLMGEEDKGRLINEVVRAVQVLSKNKIGALIVIERVTGLEEYIDTGIKIDGLVTSEFLINLFIPNTPLHDGACIIRGDRVAAAACFLPLTDAELDHDLGTRHRAGVGISEYSDALTVIVSEETGAISLCQEGKIARSLDETSLKQQLTEGLQPEGNSSPFTNLWNKAGGNQ